MADEENRTLDRATSRERLRLAARLNDWGIAEHHPFESHSLDPAYIYMARLLGFNSVKHMMSYNFTDEHFRKLELLNGPHGYTILKAMRARAR